MAICAVIFVVRGNSYSNFGWARAGVRAGARGGGGGLPQGDLISKHLQFTNLGQGNLLHRTIFISFIKVNVK